MVTALVSQASPGDGAVVARAALDMSVVVLQRQRRLEQELLDANARLQVLVKDKESLLNEVHHRVKNNLQVISSLLRLEAGRVDQTTGNTKAVLSDMQGRIRSMALLHEALYRSGNFAQLDLGVYLKQLCPQVFHAHSTGGMVRLEVELATVPVSLGQATPAGLLVNELISNCLKHAFPDGRSGVVRVSLQPAAMREGDRAGNWCLQVCDNGVGLPADFATRRTQSLGLQLVNDLAAQMQGKLTIGGALGNAGVTQGTVFAVVFTSKIGL